MNVRMWEAMVPIGKWRLRFGMFSPYSRAS